MAAAESGAASVSKGSGTPKALAERRRNEIDLGEAGAAEKPVAFDADAARDADGRQKEGRRSIDAATPDLSAAIAATSVRLSRPNSASPVGMPAMIRPEAPRHKSSR